MMRGRLCASDACWPCPWCAHELHCDGDFSYAAVTVEPWDGGPPALACECESCGKAFTIGGPRGLERLTLPPLDEHWIKVGSWRAATNGSVIVTPQLGEFSAPLLSPWIKNERFGSDELLRLEGHLSRSAEARFPHGGIFSRDYAELLRAGEVRATSEAPEEPAFVFGETGLVVAVVMPLRMGRGPAAGVVGPCGTPFAELYPDRVDEYGHIIHEAESQAEPATVH